MNVTRPAAADLPTSWREFIPPVTRGRIAVVTLLLVLAYWGTIRYGLISRWATSSTWSYGWLVPAFSLYFLASRKEQLFRTRPQPSYVGAVVLSLSLILYFVGKWWWSMGYPQHVSLVGSIFGLTLLLGGWSIIRVAWFPILFLVLGIPLPETIYVSLSLPLRKLASWTTAGILPLVVSDLWIEAQAVVIDWMMPDGRKGQLNVEDACSGMRSLMAIVALGVAMAYLDERPWWHRVIMVLSCLPIAVFCNVVRVTTTGLLHISGHEELATGTPHLILGFLTFGIALGLYALVGYVLNHLFVEDVDAGGSGSSLTKDARCVESEQSCEVAP